MPEAQAVFPKMKKGTSAPSSVPIFISSSRVRGYPAISFRVMRVVAALELPPPSPAAMGIRFRMVISMPGGDSVREIKAAAAR